jgi:peptidase M1-like protein/ERAP1-like protein
MPERGKNTMKALVAGILWLAVLLVARADDTAPRGRLPDTVAPQRYHVTVDVDPRREDFAGRTEIVIALREPSSVIWLHGLGLKVSEVTATADGRQFPARYEEVDHDTGVARVRIAGSLPAGTATLDFRYRAPLQSSGQGLYRTHAGQDWYVFSQMEAIDARRVFPGFDEPRFKTPFNLTILTHAGDSAVTNTPETHSIALKRGVVRHEYLMTKPLPTYLIAFAVGPLEFVDAGPIPPNSVRHEPLPFRIVTTRGQSPSVAFALREAPQLIRQLEEYFGIAFPFPKLDLISSPSHLGAMENAGAIIYADSLLQVGATPTPRQQSSFGGVNAHEMAHQWFGDLVTPAWWDDIWLNESFATWMGNKIADQWRPGLAIQNELLTEVQAAMDTDSLRAGRPIHQPITDSNQISTAFDEITYQKGAGVIGMVESYLGVERFQRGVRLHLQHHAYGSATASEFFASMAEGSGDPAVIDAFRSFVDQPGVPIVAVSERDGSLTLEQSRYRRLGPGTQGSEVWQIPLCARVYGAGPPTKLCTLLGGRTGRLEIPATLRGGVVFPNADGAGYYRFAVDPELLRSLLTIVPKLSAREAIALGDSVAAAFEAGRLSFSNLYDTANALARYPDRTAALALGYRLEDYRERLATPEERTLIEHALVGLYGDRLRGLGYELAPGRYASEPADQQLLRRELIGLLALDAHDPAIRAALAGSAPQAVTDPTSVDQLLRWRVWAVGLREDGAPLVGPLKTMLLETRDPAIRQDAALALASAENPQIASEVRQLVLEPRAEVSVVLSILFIQMQDPVTRPAAWSWFVEHHDAVLGRVPAMFQSFLSQLGNSFCNPAERQAFNTEVGTGIRKLNGGEIEVDRTLERIDDCYALRENTGSSIRATLEGTLKPIGH